MGVVKITGLEISACHGVLGFEKTIPQPFVFDAEMEIDIAAAATGDDLNKTVNYADVCALIEKKTTERVYNLIETLARECALSVLENFPAVKAIELTVSKPQAPVEQSFRNIGVTCRLCRERVILSCGSSIGDGRAIITAALEKLNGVRGVRIKKVSSFLQTEPYGGVAKNPFVNCAAEAECLLSPWELLEAIHRTEEQAGRVRKVRWEDRTLDIDIIFFGGRIIAKDGLAVPHPDYSNRDFVLIPVKEIAPDFVCPVTRKRMSDL